MKNKKYTQAEELHYISDAKQDILFHLNVMTDSTNACPDKVKKLAVAYNELTEAYSVQAGMQDAVNHSLHELEHKILNMPLSVHDKLRTAGGAEELLESHHHKVRDAYHAMKNSTGTHQEYVEALLELSAIAAIEHQAMTC